MPQQTNWSCPAAFQIVQCKHRSTAKSNSEIHRFTMQVRCLIAVTAKCFPTPVPVFIRFTYLYFEYLGLVYVLVSAKHFLCSARLPLRDRGLLSSCTKKFKQEEYCT